jgi:hypothetical protein
MTNEPSQVSSIRFRMENGFDALEEWGQTASPAQKDAVYKALFAMQDGTLFRSYRVIDDFQRTNEVHVIVKDDLAMKIRIKSVDAFDVVAIGPCGHHTRGQLGRLTHDSE